MLVEDDRDIANNLMYKLKDLYKIDNARSYKEAINLLKEKYDLVIMDITLPDGDGVELYKNYVKGIPTIFLTAVSDEEKIVDALNSGAEDYMVKPFSTKELVARINKIFRINKNKTIKVKDITFDVDRLSVYKGDVEVVLTALEIKIVQLFFSNINRIVTREYILESIWNWTGNDVNDNTVTVYLKRIREKLGTDIIKTIKGIGYRIDDE